MNFLFRILKRFQSNWDDLLRKYESSEERLQGDGGSFDSILDHIDQEKQDALPFEKVSATMTEIIFANQDVLQPALTWLFADALVYQQSLESLDLPKSWETMDKPTLETEHVGILNWILESARVHPFFPITLAEITDKEIEVGGYQLPNGTKVSIDQYSLNHNPKYWSNPTKFQPERFNDSDDFKSKWCMFRFGFGSRRCPGQYYANLVLANAFARLFSKYRLVPLNLKGVSHHHDVPLLRPGRVTMLPDCKIQLVPKGT